MPPKLKFIYQVIIREQVAVMDQSSKLQLLLKMTSLAVMTTFNTL